MITCADDYGLRQDIDDAIIDLIDLGRVSAVACLVGFERCDTRAMSALAKRKSSIDIGLHFVMTREEQAFSGSPAIPRGAACPFGSFEVLLVQALMGGVSRQFAARHLAAQYELFVQKCGRP